MRTMILIILTSIFCMPNLGHATKLTWQRLEGLLEDCICSLAIDPSNPSTIYAGTVNGLVADKTCAGKGVYKSTDGGESWNLINTGLPENSLTYMIAVDPVSPSTLYVGTFLKNAPEAEEGMFKSIDGGQNWDPINNGLTNKKIHSEPIIDPTTPSTLYIGTEDGVFKSTNGGESWFLTTSDLGFIEINLSAIDPSNPSIIYASDHGGGLLKSINGGESWFPINNGLPETAGSAVIDPTNSQIVYAGSEGGGVFKSSNGGESWSPINNGLTNKSVFSLAIDPSNPDVLYAGTWGGGVFRTANGGGSWSPYNSGLTNLIAIPFVFNPSSPSTLYTGTLGGGIFKGIITQPALADVILALQVMSGLNPLGIPADYNTFDINSDGKVGLGEAIYILKQIAGTESPSMGFTMEELAGNSYSFIDADYPGCIYHLTFNEDGSTMTPGGEENYSVIDGVIRITRAQDPGLKSFEVISREGSTTRALFTYSYDETFVDQTFVDQTAQWGMDFSLLNNAANALANWFITNGSYPYFTADGHVKVPDETIEGHWHVSNNTIYFSSPDGECVDYKAYKLVDDRLLFATDAPLYNQTFIMVHDILGGRTTLVALNKR